MSTSGVATQSRWLINGLLRTGKYSFRCFGGAVQHENYDTVVVNDDFIIKPTKGFGDQDMLRKALVELKPDALMLFTDPRFFTYVWAMHDEIHQICPIAYWHLWDNPPWPEFNRPFYEATDLINCINWPTYEMVHERFPDKTHYIPHAVPEDLYKPFSNEDRLKAKEMFLGRDRLDHFVCLFVGRNARRKMPSDILQSWKMFLDHLEAKHGHKKATLVLHTDPMDVEGTNLFMLIDLFGLRDNVVFSKDRIEFENMSALYNICDTNVNRSCFSAGTRVMTRNGFLPIEEIQPGHEVMTHKKRWKHVIDLIRNDGRNSNMLTLKYSNGNPISCTSDHKILAIKKNEIPKKAFFSSHGIDITTLAKLTPANELKVGDYVVATYALSSNESKVQKIDLFDYVKNLTYLRAGHKETKTYTVVDGKIFSSIMRPLYHGPESVTVDENFAYVLGNWAADGATNSSSVSFNKKDKEKIKRFVEAVKQSLKMDCVIREKARHVDVTIQNGAITSMMFKDLCGLYSDGKKVPEIIQKSSLCIKRAFLNGYLAGDGCILTHPNYNTKLNRIRTISSNVAAGLRTILVELGYVPSVKEDDNSHGFNKSGRIWTIEWRDRQHSVNGSCRSWNIDGSIISRIYDITNCEKQNIVYDLTVDEDHTYMVENVTVSNCNEGFGLPILESMMCGKPPIVIKTGGLTRQVEDPDTGEQNGIGLDPDVKTLIGNHMVPFIYEDFVSHETLRDALIKMYDMGPEKRQVLGTKAMERAKREYNLNSVVQKWDQTLTHTIDSWKQTPARRWSIETI